MRFPMDRPVKVVMLGAGGTGGYVAPYLFRLLHMLDRPARFIICDGDLVEAKNLDRQNFVEADLGENKARVLSERYSAVLGMETEYVPNFIETLPELMTLIEPGEWETDGYPRRKVREMVLLLGCVDNNRTRQLCHEAFKKSLDLIYIDSGNGSYTGQVVCGVRKNGRTVRRPIGGVHPEMLKVIDRFPSELSCAEAAQADPQSIVANVTAATAVLTMVYNILTHGENIALQTDFSTRTIRMQTVLEKQPRRKVTEEYDSEVQWAKLEEAHPLAFEDSSQLEEMTPSFSARKEELHHVRHIHMLTRGAGVAAAVIVLSTVTANALGFHPIHAILQWAEGIVQVCINPSGTMELPDNTPSEYHSLTEALKCNGIDADGLPTWIPQDYSISSVTAKITDGVTRCVAVFESERGELTMRVTAYSMENTSATEERDEMSVCYSKGNVDYYIISNYDQSKVAWQLGLNTYVIGGQISENEAKEIIDSIT